MIKYFYTILKNYFKFIQSVSFLDIFKNDILKNSLYQNQYILKNFFKLLKNIFFIVLITMQMPDILIDYINEIMDINEENKENKMTDKDKQIIMVCFVLISAFLSYVLNNYQCEAPRYYPQKPPF